MISIVTGAIGLCVAALIIFLIRNDRLHTNHGIGWILVAGGFAFLGFAPEIVDYIAKYLGVSYPPALALTLALIVLVIKILFMDIERSHIELRSQRLIQRVAMLEADLHRWSKVMEHKDSTEKNKTPCPADSDRKI